MADITMCTNKGCRLSPKCYRFSAVPDRLQSYASFQLTKEPDGREVCEYYLFLHDGDVVMENGKQSTIGNTGAI